MQTILYTRCGLFKRGTEFLFFISLFQTREITFSSIAGPLSILSELHTITEA